ncbi:MAG TPA: 16S rRNA (adenine(1518)-N(6)/adenine(1519)-N(6))-dimethyltransferase RsmA [Burkholderiaceae bacterium]|nr:16S rRNA (adenine(1518)-N(6)/adenine(1519)-N(6))-dimethyltransferase RsmA [Burkholderiaceae bacterium]
MKHAARRRFGQHFLADTSVVDAIVRAIDPHPGQALVEIGPGLGAMTQPLVERCGDLVVIEIDRDLAARLRQRPRLDVMEADVLSVDFSALAARLARPLRVVGNLPYNISTPILFHLLAHASHVQDQHFMLQKEVVDRMGAVPGNKDYGRLSVMLQWRYDIEPLFDVAPGAFEPPPRVQSAIVRMQPLPNVQDIPAGVLGELVTVAFSQRRKLLRHTLGAWLAQRGCGAGFDLQRRAEEVSVAEYLALAREASGSAPPQ